MTLLRHPLYRAAVEDPDNDDPRLLLADWMDDLGDPRGQFIRVQLRMARIDVTSHELNQLRDVESEMLRRHRKHFNAPIHRHIQFQTGLRVKKRRGDIRGWVYVRGLPERLTINMDAFLRHHAAIAEIGPIRHVRFYARSRASHRLFREECVRPLRSISFVQNSRIAANLLIREIASSPHLMRLETLDLSHLTLSLQAARTLAHSTRLPSLRRLIVQNCSMGADARRVLRGRFGSNLAPAGPVPPPSHAPNIVRLGSSWLQRLIELTRDTHF